MLRLVGKRQAPLSTRNMDYFLNRGMSKALFLLYLTCAPSFSCAFAPAAPRGLLAVVVVVEGYKKSRRLAVTTSDLEAELDLEGLRLCHGILHASGVRCLADMKDLTATQIDDMGADHFDRREINRVVARLNKSCAHEAAPTGAQLSTETGDAFALDLPRRFEKARNRDFEFEAISQEHNVYKGRLFTKMQSKELIRMAEYSAYRSSGVVGAGWGNEIYTLTAQHMQCKDVPGFLPLTKQIFRDLLRELYTLFPKRILNGSIVFGSDSEPHLVKYSGKARGTELHTDNSEQYGWITVNVLLSDSADFSGGGTYIQVLDKTILLEQGEMIIHLGDLEHAGAEITSGVRHLLVAFIECEWDDGPSC